MQSISFVLLNLLLPLLASLSIKNYALIDEMQVTFHNGLTIITGETGAGKSILLGGLSLVLGKRADLTQIKDTSRKCVIEAVFDIANYDLKPLFSTEDLDYEIQTYIRREILPSGKSRAFINDTPVTLDVLNHIGTHLIDIHSQHQTTQLINDAYQFKVIDALAKNNEILNAYSKALKAYHTSEKELDVLKQKKSDAVKEYDYNVFLLKELEDAKLVDGELETLETTHDQLSHTELITEKLGFAKNTLNNEDVGIVELLNALKRQLAAISDFGPQYEAIRHRIESVSIELDDVLSEIDVLQDALISDPEALERVSTKLQILNNLFNKHAVNEVNALIRLREELSEKVSQTDEIDGLIADKEIQLADLKRKLEKFATEIHELRKMVTPEFIEKLEAILYALGMPNASFKILIEKRNVFRQNGMDELKFLFTANKGTNYTELKKAASGGELSRIMLAVKAILAEYIQLPTIMFDEIDTGVSGEISNNMGDIMKKLSKKLQVFTITHLPQVAAKGDSHFKVFKTDKETTTATQIKQLTQEERIVEIAQMLGGLNISDSAIAHAKQLLN